jgi:hypothetical protein
MVTHCACPILLDAYNKFQNGNVQISHANDRRRNRGFNFSVAQQSARETFSKPSPVSPDMPMSCSFPLPLLISFNCQIHHAESVVSCALPLLLCSIIVDTLTINPSDNPLGCPNDEYHNASKSSIVNENKFPYIPCHTSAEELTCGKLVEGIGFSRKAYSDFHPSFG